MLDDFFIRAILGGIGVAVVAGPLGCFVIWRRLAYFGDTLSHSALLGVALAFLFELNITLHSFLHICSRGIAFNAFATACEPIIRCIVRIASTFSSCRWTSSSGFHDLDKS